MNKTLVFDMDGTLCDLYGVQNWLEKLRNEDATPYQDATPIYDMLELTKICFRLKARGWKIAVTTWGAMNASGAYNKRVALMKKTWLNKYHFPADYFFFQTYGTPKNQATSFRKGRQILIDDNETVRNTWNGETIDATKNILKELRKLYEAEKNKKMLDK